MARAVNSPKSKMVTKMKVEINGIFFLILFSPRAVSRAEDAKKAKQYEQVFCNV